MALPHTTAPTETYTVRFVPNPGLNINQPWLPGATATEIPALCRPDGSTHRFLGHVSLDEAVAKAGAHMAKWATPRTVVARKNMGDIVELTAVVGEFVG